MYYTLDNTSDRRTIFHLILQVYCSLSMKEHLHNPVMTLLACNIKRTVSILHAHGSVFGCVCVCDVCVNVHGCEVVYTCALVCAFMCVSTFRMVDTNLQVYLHVSVITQAQNNTLTVLAIANIFSCYMFITDTMSLYVDMDALFI